MTDRSAQFSATCASSKAGSVVTRALWGERTGTQVPTDRTNWVELRPMDIVEGLTTTEAACGKVRRSPVLPPRIRTMHAHFRTLSFLTLGASLLLGACTIIQDPVTPINPPARREPAPPPASPPPPAATVATPAPPVATPATPADPGVAVPAPPVATPVPGTTADPAPPVRPKTPIGTVKPKRPGMRIPRLPIRPRPAPGTEPKQPGHVSPTLPKQPVKPGPAGNGRADGTACSTSSECASGICEGMGCGWNQGKCAPAQRSCTRDLRVFCGCDGKDFQSSSTCPGRVFRSPGSCNQRR